MGFIKKIKDFVTGGEENIPVLSICMMGPRSVGKTTVLTSIFAESQDKIGEGSNIYLRSGDDTTAQLNDYYLMLVDAVEKKNAANLPASNVQSKFLFELGLRGNSNASVRLSIQDFPGEYLNGRKEERQYVYDFMSGATVILIAIDTPYLMEDKGKYNEQKNQVSIVTHYLKDNISAVKDKLVLFVPLKCERYAHDKRIEGVTSKVEATYGELIEFFKKNNIASVITPIQTLGGMEFDHMEDNTSGLGGIKKIAVYRPWATKPQYRPLYCPQPLYYLLTYVSNHYEWLKKQDKGFIDNLKSSIYSFFKKDTKFLEEMKKMSKYILYDKNGFKLVTTNNILKIN